MPFRPDHSRRRNEGEPRTGNREPRVLRHVALAARFAARCALFAVFTSLLPAQTRAARALDAAVEAGIAQGTYPAAVVIVGRSDTVLHAKGYGRYAWRGDTRLPDPAWSLWDVASITKVVATASATAVLVDRGQLDLDTPVHRFLPEFRGPLKDSVTVRMLLEHTSGLPAWAPLGTDDGTPRAAWRRLFTIDLRRPPGEAPVYSDLNAMLAGLVVEKVTGQPLEQFTSTAVFAPMGMGATTWRPTLPDRLRAVPTDVHLDGLPYFGEVQDPNARVMGGVAGHAGVFATGTDLAKFAQSWLRGVRSADSSWVSPATMRRFVARRDSASTRALGWDSPLLVTGDGKPPLYGACATATTVGHTGYTGTLLWIDPAADLFVVFLTNRSLEAGQRSTSEIRDVRAAVSDAARRLAGGRC
jgi:CubicO group peptidase (beta-lactamase class C family)